MTRRQFILSIAVLGTLGVRPARSRAQDERIVYGDIVRWLKTLFHPLDQIGDLIDRTRFVTSLTDLEASFEAMHKDTQEIVEILRRSPLDRYKLTQVGTHLSESVGPCAAQLTDVARVLKQQYREQGERIASDLSETLSRKGWLAAIVAQAVRDDELREMAQMRRRRPNPWRKSPRSWPSWSRSLASRPRPYGRSANGGVGGDALTTTRLTRSGPATSGDLGR